MAKPFTGPDPKKNKIVAAIKVVIFASKTAVFAFLYPLSKAKILFFQRVGMAELSVQVVAA